MEILERRVSSPGLLGPGPAIKPGEDDGSASGLNLEILERRVSSPGLPGPGPAIKPGEDDGSASESGFESESDPRASFAREIAKYRPHSPTMTSLVPDTSNGCLFLFLMLGSGFMYIIISKSSS